jgi:hypothetical protein
MIKGKVIYEYCAQKIEMCIQIIVRYLLGKAYSIQGGKGACPRSGRGAVFFQLPLLLYTRRRDWPGKNNDRDNYRRATGICTRGCI